MSLILDALRRADAERERGAVPGLHAQSMPLPSAEPEPPARTAPWRWLAVATTVLLLAVLAWILGGRGAGREGIASTPTPASSAPRAADALPQAVAPSPPARPPAAPAPLAREALPVAEPAPWPSPDARKAVATNAAAPSPAATAAPAPPVPRDQLPDNVRARLPPLVVGGSIYSAAAADRSLILDGRIHREGDLLAPDLKLERIGARTAVLQFKGYRFEIVY
jgi:general secretion pathway protein B